MNIIVRLSLLLGVYLKLHLIWHTTRVHGQKIGANYTQALKHTFRDVEYTKEEILTLKGVDSEVEFVLHVYTDVSLSKRHGILRRSVSGYVILINNSAVVWKIIKQYTDCTKYSRNRTNLSAVAGVLRVGSIQQTLADMKIYIAEIQVYIDCQALVNTIYKEEIDDTNGYLAIQLAVVIHRRHNQLLKVHHVKGTNNVDDLLTKPFAVPSHRIGNMLIACLMLQVLTRDMREAFK